MARKNKTSLAQSIVKKQQTRTRNDINSWVMALREADNILMPKRVRLQNLYNDVTLDALLSSQIEARTRRALSAPWQITDAAGNPDEMTTEAMRASLWKAKIDNAILNSIYRGTTLIELQPAADDLSIAMIPQTNIIPDNGTVLRDETDHTGIKYRELKEYNIFLLEFGEVDNRGLLNKAIPHVLFKKFAQSCWSELCEIFGIPPRYIKTDTTDPAMINRASQMLSDMGASAAFVIDKDEEFQFASTSSTTNGDVYNALIKLCNNEISMLIAGAIIGQDTTHGNYSKEEASLDILKNIVETDKTLLASSYNHTVLPALARIGITPPDRKLEFLPEEDTQQLWERTAEAMKYHTVDPEWLQDTFGIPIIAKPTQTTTNTLAAEGASFFD